MAEKPRIIIVGAGMAGCFLALSLAKKGHSILIIEKRDSLNSLMKEEGRSFNLTLYYRGIEALKKISLWETVKQYAQIAEGNVAHFTDGTTRFDLFDNEHEVLYTIHRTSLNKALIKEAQKHPNITFAFHTECTGLDKVKKVLLTRDTRRSSIKRYSYDILVGADGAHSMIRTLLQQSQESNHSLVFSDWGYKEVWISPEKAVSMHLREKATHTWPRDNSLLLAFPNPDGSCTLMFNLPLTGKDSFAELMSKKAIKEYVKTYFPELMSIQQEIVDSLLAKPLGNFVTVKTSPWYYKDSIVLVGDAAHAVLPFYGQGMCAAFEDCLSLIKNLTTFSMNREKAFAKYQKNRKRNTDILAELSVSNFIELRDRSRSERFILKDQLYTLLHSLFPTFCQPPLYVLVAHSSLSYADAVKLFARQEKIARFLGIDLLLTIVVGGKKIIRKSSKLLSKVPTPTFVRTQRFNYPIR